MRDGRKEIGNRLKDSLSLCLTRSLSVSLCLRRSVCLSVSLCVVVLYWANGAVGQQVSLSQIVSSVTHTHMLTQAHANMQVDTALSHYHGPCHCYHGTQPGDWCDIAVL